MSASHSFAARPRIDASTLVELLAPALGKQAAQEAVDHARMVIGETRPDLSRDQALHLLEVVAEQPGLVGITGRFAKSRVLLQWK
ncbi:MAG: hypothetical protein H6718_08705 [Polyangiaceae bacterium]|nr:hypothetical protein [Myxococcales bacterium]MCB9585464.1 hypothetical protein [Polyangiaceae bacterium]MCB9606520.1 hypothetical protein [Polyangiaceae bacterium]